MKIFYQGLCVRNAESADCPQLASWWNDGKIMAHAGSPMGWGQQQDRYRSRSKATATGRSAG